jgi:Zn-dependent peptidase ImmA (M78 family)
MAVRKALIRQQAEALLAKFEVVGGPVPVEKIARALGIDIKLDEVDDNLSGFLVRDEKGKKTVIGANKSHHPNRRRFTIAHELGHYLLHKGQLVHLDENRVAFTVNLRNSESAKGEDPEEREANLFAAELLMPAKFLKRDLYGQDLDLLEGNDALVGLADKYKVSVQALTFRLANLGYITP